MRENAPPPPGGPKPPEAADNTFNVEDIFSTYDTDEDGNWSTAELQNFLLENFSSIRVFQSEGLDRFRPGGPVDLNHSIRRDIREEAWQAFQIRSPVIFSFCWQLSPENSGLGFLSLNLEAI